MKTRIVGHSWSRLPSEVIRRHLNLDKPRCRARVITLLVSSSIVFALFTGAPCFKFGGVCGCSISTALAERSNSHCLSCWLGGEEREERAVGTIALHEAIIVLHKPTLSVVGTNKQGQNRGFYLHQGSPNHVHGPPFLLSSLKYFEDDYG